jgi:hypothetical protein
MPHASRNNPRNHGLSEVRHQRVYTFMRGASVTASRTCPESRNAGYPSSSIARVRDVVNARMPSGYEETMQYGMIAGSLRGRG